MSQAIDEAAASPARRTSQRLPKRDSLDASVVRSYTEWDPLEEVIVGRLTGAVFPTWQPSMGATMPEGSWRLFQELGGCPLPEPHLSAAQRELDAFAGILDEEGIKVVRPERASHAAGFSTPHWQSAGGLYAAMPRDSLMIVGDTIIEAPMSWRCRYHEADAFRSLIKSYFARGAGWLPAPRPQLTDELFTPWEGSTGGLAITEFEPVFDAADFVRFGHDIVVQKSHVTNEFGIRWLERAIGRDYRVHRIAVDDPRAMHIDATIMPLAPGKLLVNEQRYLPNRLFADWEILVAPPPTLPADWPMYFCSPWVSMNVLSLDSETVVVERHEEPLIEALTGWGFRCILVDFRYVYSFGGSFHCVTLDVRRDGDNGTYLNG